MTLLTIRTQIITEIGGRTDLDSVIDDQVNYALQELTTMFEFEQLQGDSTTTTTADQAEYLLPTDLYVLWSVREESVKKGLLELKDWQTYRNVDTGTSGKPNWYTQYNRKLILFNSVPDDNATDNYTIRILYWQTHAALSADADNVTTPAEWERGLRLKATSFMFTILDMDEKAAAKSAEFDRWVGRITIPRANAEAKQDTTRANFGYRRRR